MEIEKNQGLNKTEKRKAFFDFIIVFVLLYINCSLWSLQVSFMLRVVVTMAILFWSMSRYKLRFTRARIILVIVMCCSIIISCLFNLYISNLDISVILIWGIALITCSIIPYDVFCDGYIRVMVLIAFWSSILYAISLVDSSVFSGLPDIANQTWTGQLIPKNAIVAVIDVTSRYKRNWGIFYEPGFFAFYINMAIYIMLFIKCKFQMKYFVILTIALLTTMSTNGYITFALMMVTFLLEKRMNVGNGERKKIKKYQKRLLILGLLIGSTLIVFFKNNPDSWDFFSSKLSELGGDAAYGSGYERLQAIIIAIQAITTKPILGHTALGLSDFFAGNIATFSPLTWLAYYGVIYGVICNILYSRYALLTKNSIVGKVLRIICLYSMIVSQNICSNIIIIILLVYVVDIRERRESSNDFSDFASVQYSKVS